MEKKVNKVIILVEDLEWLERSAYGQLRSVINCGSVECSLFKEGIISQDNLMR